MKGGGKRQTEEESQDEEEWGDDGIGVGRQKAGEEDNGGCRRQRRGALLCCVAALRRGGAFLFALVADAATAMGKVMFTGAMRHETRCQWVWFSREMEKCLREDGVGASVGTGAGAGSSGGFTFWGTSTHGAWSCWGGGIGAAGGEGREHLRIGIGRQSGVVVEKWEDPCEYLKAGRGRGCRHCWYPGGELQSNLCCGHRCSGVTGRPGLAAKKSGWNSARKDVNVVSWGRTRLDRQAWIFGMGFFNFEWSGEVESGEWRTNPERMQMS